MVSVECRYNGTHTSLVALSMQNHLAAPRLATVQRFFDSRSSTDLMGSYG